MEPKTNGANPVGIYKRFGELGPVYRVMEVEKDSAEEMLLVSVVESGENVHYPYRKFLQDPKA